MTLLPEKVIAQQEKQTLAKDLKELKKLGYKYSELWKYLEEHDTVISRITNRSDFSLSLEKTRILQKKVDTFKNKLWR